MTTARSTAKAGKVFDLDVLQAEADLRPFRFRLAGREHELPHAGMLSGEQALDLEGGKPRQVLEQVAGGPLTDELMAIPSHALNALLDGWLKHSGATAGE